ncbi:D-alanyl-D-alanine endopeptidase [Vogesella sp. LIG4]|uniref:D-alanyl-D-alanine endopeptidase n=1 Tax=Vogesella sp. LIG4 TaxID=1192162 RepID=UPI00081F77C9|nr:D-alanyl-D-alanine endopeptidase [Vogesella sp. LIG4]SCK20923.1 D-alanyl-D-alanine endopeptidase (penicillin-binding protein 7) [Vogesella sp. LIG4]
MMLRTLAMLICLAGAPLVADASQKVSLAATTSGPRLSSHSVAVVDAESGQLVYEKNANQIQPFASITKLMTAMVTLDANLPLDDSITISDDEVDRIKRTTSRLAVGSTLSRHEMLLLALMSSENRAAASLARTYPGGKAAFIAQMNRKAKSLGMHNTEFHDATGLDVRNTSTAMDLVRMVKAAYNYPLIRQFTTTAEYDAHPRGNRVLHYKNSNPLVREGVWDIALSKTGYIEEAGRCLVMQTMVGSQRMIMVLLDANGSAARVNDAKSIKTWLEAHPNTWLSG